MNLIIKLFVITMAIVNGQITFSEPPRAPEPQETVYVDVQGEAEEVYPDFTVLDATDNYGNEAVAPNVPGYMEKVHEGMVDGVPSEAGLEAMEEYWTLFWAMNPELLTK